MSIKNHKFSVPVIIFCLVLCLATLQRLEAGVTGISAVNRFVTLFIIERSKNANIVEYDANIDPQGNIHSEQPIHACWKLLAEDGRIAELSLFEQKAYGFNCTYDRTTGEYQLVINSFKERKIKVYKEDNTVRAETIINGKPAYLERVYIKAEQSVLLPSVKYLELYGKDKALGTLLYEKINI